MNSSALNVRTVAQTANVLIVDRLHSGRIFCFTVSTESMCPTIRPGDRVRFRAASADDLRPGVILVRKAGDGWIVHRLIERLEVGDETLLVTKGDNALTADAAWPLTQLTGVVVGVERGSHEQIVESIPDGWQPRLIALLSRAQLWVGRLKPAACRRTAIKLSRFCLRAVVRL